MKEEIRLIKAKWLLEPGCVVLVTSGTMQRANVMTFSWQTLINSNNPCLVLLVIGRSKFSYELIQKNHQFTINVPGEELLEQTHFVGSITGRNIDKFKESGLTPVPAKVVEPPLIDECAGHLECRVAEVIKTKNHDLLIGEVLRAVADSVLFDGRWIPERFHTLHYLGANTYGILDRSKMPKNCS